VHLYGVAGIDGFDPIEMDCEEAVVDGECEYTRRVCSSGPSAEREGFSSHVCLLPRVSGISQRWRFGFAVVQLGPFQLIDHRSHVRRGCIDSFRLSGSACLHRIARAIVIRTGKKQANCQPMITAPLGIEFAYQVAKACRTSRFRPAWISLRDGLPHLDVSGPTGHITAVPIGTAMKYRPVWLCNATRAQHGKAIKRLPATRSGRGLDLVGQHLA
jgi:hypothetical protein